MVARLPKHLEFGNKGVVKNGVVVSSSTRNNVEDNFGSPGDQIGTPSDGF